MILETERLILRDWSPADSADLILGLNDLEVSRLLAVVPFPYTQQDADQWFAYCKHFDKDVATRTTYEFAIELKSEGRIIGGPTLNQINWIHGTAGGGIWINRSFHGLGYGSEAFGKRIRFAFEDLDLRRLENGFIAGNFASKKMLGRLGYVIEGTRRAKYRCLADGLIKDEIVAGLLRDEWESL